ncbi:unnamed protein product [Pleuronectes platessa]|uniref:Uncharacterized protein n=1 Tax=Pleuronectes platessa TaxID=8262 RepID=A0A9N7YP93_PLEPL|nr:unnamed protein product [Pleuronectes platessa]
MTAGAAASRTHAKTHRTARVCAAAPNPAVDSSCSRHLHLHPPLDDTDTHLFCSLTTVSLPDDGGKMARSVHRSRT